MGSGRGGLYSGTYGSRAAVGSAIFTKADDDFGKYIGRRRDIDSNGFYDLVAHGEPGHILVEHNGVQVSVDHRVAARLLKNDSNYHGGSIRLLSCNTGKVSSGFAQNLANKLNRPVKAPTDYLWATQDGKYFVAGGKKVNGVLMPDRSKPGKFKTYYPQKGRTKN